MSLMKQMLLVFILIAFLMSNIECDEQVHKPVLNKRYPYEINKMDAKTFLDADVNEDDDGTATSDCSDPDTCEMSDSPCNDHVCGYGRECIVQEGRPACDCAKYCPGPDVNKKVCSNQNETFNNICHLYREKCFCKRRDWQCINDDHIQVDLDYIGQCKLASVCERDSLDDLSDKVSQYIIQNLDKLKQTHESYGENWLDMINDPQLMKVFPIMYKFCNDDDKTVLFNELISITASIIPHEPCLSPMLEHCDQNNDKQITIREWERCLGVKESQLIQHCW